MLPKAIEMISVINHLNWSITDILSLAEIVTKLDSEIKFVKIIFHWNYFVSLYGNNKRLNEKI